MRRHILIPTDYSENAWSAVLYALRLYANKPCTFYFLHSWTFVNTGGRTYISPSYIDKLKNASTEQLNAIKDRAAQESSNEEHQFETLFSVDYLLDALKVAIKKHAIDMVVMGTKGATGAVELLMGSNAVTVINRIRHCPILLVPDEFRFAAPAQIAFSTGFNRSYGEELETIKEFALLHNSKVKILHIMGKEDLSDEQQENLVVLKDNLKPLPHSFSWMPEKGKKEEVISKFIKEYQIDVLTMINYKHNFFEDLVKEPVIKKIGYHASIPFLVVPTVS